MKLTSEEVQIHVSVDFNHRDETEKARLEAENADDCIEYQRLADMYDVDPQPIPHIHTRHETLSAVCAFVAVVALFAGAVVASMLTANSVQSHLVGLSLGILFFVTATCLTDLLLLLLCDEQVFVRRSRWFWIPGWTLFLLSVTVLLLGRFADAELADLLLSLTSWAWWGIELSLLWLTAVALAGWRHYGWSGRIVRRCRARQSEIARLTRNLARRRPLSSGGLKIAVLGLVVMLLLLVPTPSRAQVPKMMVDETGSVADADRLDQHLAAAVADRAGEMRGLDVILFSEHIYSAEPIPVRWKSSGEELAPEPVRRAWREKLAKMVHAELEEVFKTKLPPAHNTCVLDMVIRASAESKPVLVITDAKNECRPPAKFDVVSGDGVFIVLVRSKSDTGSDKEIYDQRKKGVERYISGATIVEEFRLEGAIEKWIRAANPPDGVRRVAQVR
ncbi:MAG: hypothetical protein WA655_23920 [Candidatus Korobacteraceae bacterium]